MPPRFTKYFEHKVMPRRPYLRKEWCIRALLDRVRVERQRDGRFRFRIAVPELGGRYLRVITLEDRATIQNAFPDRGFKP